MFWKLFKEPKKKVIHYYLFVIFEKDGMIYCEQIAKSHNEIDWHNLAIIRDGLERSTELKDFSLITSSEVTYV